MPTLRCVSPSLLSRSGLRLGRQYVRARSARHGLCCRGWHVWIDENSLRVSWCRGMSCRITIWCLCGAVSKPYHPERGSSFRQVHRLAILWTVYACVQALQVPAAAGAQGFHSLHEANTFMICLRSLRYTNDTADTPISSTWHETQQVRMQLHFKSHRVDA